MYIDHFNIVLFENYGQVTEVNVIPSVRIHAIPKRHEAWKYVRITISVEIYVENTEIRSKVFFWIRYRQHTFVLI